MNISTPRAVPAFEDYKLWSPVEDWTELQARDVEVHDRKGLVDQGRVDAVTADGSVLWMQQDGASSRRIGQKTPGTNIRLG
ncbi:hypothetical protein [Paenarthrobacter nitroguajacolicus]|uniref:hypothetical protein n=1 Tax=Paenarthrobacter nitroguajacolicus TaxID=211146 RepID=UPI0034480557